MNQLTDHSVATVQLLYTKQLVNQQLNPHPMLDKSGWKKIKKVTNILTFVFVSDGVYTATSILLIPKLSTCSAADR